jgi:mRNA interferase HigB
MHIITHKRIREFVAKYPDSQSSLKNWYHIISQTNYDTFSQLKQHFSSADYVDGFIVFNISGNKYRLIAAIHFNRKKVYIRGILTHSEYDKGQWKK